MVILSTLFNRRYHDKPEGQDPVGKLFAPLKVTLTTSLAISMLQVMQFGRELYILPTINQCLFWIVPMCSTCLAFTSITYISTNLRKKDDAINYLAGGNQFVHVYIFMVKDTLIF
jgi:hypothetical protein